MRSGHVVAGWHALPLLAWIALLIALSVEEHPVAQQGECRWSKNVVCWAASGTAERDVALFATVLVVPLLAVGFAIALAVLPVLNRRTGSRPLVAGSLAALAGWLGLGLLLGGYVLVR